MTQTRSFAALIIEKVWLPKPCMWRKLFGMPRSRHDDRHLVQRLGQQRPEVPVVVGAAQAGARVALDRVVEVGEAQRIAEEEHRRVVADDVPVAFLGVELHREAADVALGVGRAALAGDGREAHEHRSVCLPTSEKIFALV